LHPLSILSILLATAAAAPALPPDRAQIEPQPFRYRASSLVVGPRGTFTFFDSPPCRYLGACPPGVVLGFSSEFGSRIARVLIELNTAPIPYFSGDVAVVEGINLHAGGMFGNERFRGGVTASTGYAALVGGDARFVAAPWVDAQGGRHGIEVRVGGNWWGAFHVGLHYRWFPRLLNRLS
jgi:hypothetical protein